MKKVFVLAKAFEVHDHQELWANEEKNREAMMKHFGLEFPEAPKPDVQSEESGKDNKGDDLPFGDDTEDDNASCEDCDDNSED